jgi:hypothetical protein
VTSLTRVSSSRQQIVRLQYAHYDGRSESIFTFHIFGLFIFKPNKNISGLIALLSSNFPTWSPPKLRHLSSHEPRFFYSLFTAVRGTRYRPSCHKTFYLVAVFKFMAAKIFLQRWKQMFIIRRRISHIITVRADPLVTKLCAKYTYFLTGPRTMHCDWRLQYKAERYNQAQPRRDIDHRGERQHRADRAVSCSNRHGLGTLLHV